MHASVCKADSGRVVGRELARHVAALRACAHKESMICVLSVYITFVRDLSAGSGATMSR